MIEVKRKVHIPIYGGWIIVVITDEDNVYQAAKRHFKCTLEKGNLYQAVVLDSESILPRNYPVILTGNLTPGLIAHESVHLVHKLFRDLGINVSFDDDEHYAYLMTWIVNRIWEVKMKYEKLLNDRTTTHRLNPC